MPKGEHLDRSHQSLAGMRPRPGRRPSAAAVASAKLPGETMDEASLRLQIARADTEELDRAKRALELDVARGELVTKSEAVDLAQEAVLRVVQILDMLPERMRARLPAHLHPACDEMDAIIREARAAVAAGG